MTPGTSTSPGEPSSRLHPPRRRRHRRRLRRSLRRRNRSLQRRDPRRGPRRRGPRGPRRRRARPRLRRCPRCPRSPLGRCRRGQWAVDRRPARRVRQRAPGFLVTATSQRGQARCHRLEHGMLTGSVHGDLGDHAPITGLFGPALFRSLALPSTGLRLSPSRRGRIDRVGVQQDPAATAVRHDVENASISPVPNRLRVNCTSPSDVTSDTWWRVRSRASDSVNRRNTKSRLDSSTMSMKSMTTMPPISRSRSWRTISSAASRLFLVTVCSRLPRLR